MNAQRPPAGTGDRNNDRLGGAIKVKSTARLRPVSRIHGDRLPADLEAELSVLAHLADPLHPAAGLDGVDGSWFYDQRHARIIDALRSGRALSADDDAYKASAVKYAFPITAAIVTSFVDHHRRRVRLLELEAERLELLGVVA